MDYSRRPGSTRKVSCKPCKRRGARVRTLRLPWHAWVTEAPPWQEAAAAATTFFRLRRDGWLFASAETTVSSSLRPIEGFQFPDSTAVIIKDKSNKVPINGRRTFFSYNAVRIRPSAHVRGRKWRRNVYYSDCSDCNIEWRLAGVVVALELFFYHINGFIKRRVNWLRTLAANARNQFPELLENMLVAPRSLDSRLAFASLRDRVIGKLTVMSIAWKWSNLRLENRKVRSNIEYLSFHLQATKRCWYITTKFEMYKFTLTNRNSRR